MTITRDICALTAGTLLAASAAAQPLTGTGPNLLLPFPDPGPPAEQIRTATPAGPGWTGTWTAPAAASWVGSFSAIGPIPTGTNPVGTTRYDFTTLPTGLLPVGTYFRFGDVDGGSTTNETFTLRAFDTGGNVITSPWLDQPLTIFGSGTGPGSSILPGNTPGWNWNAGTGDYLIDGSTVTGGNPSLSVYLESNTAIASMQLTRTSTFASFSLSAPLVPAPAAAGLLGLGGLAASRRRR